MVDGRVLACQPLITWLQIALTKSDTIASAVWSPTPSSPLGDTLLINYQHTLLERDLPGLNQSLSEGAALIAQNLGALVADNKLARQGEDSRRAAALVTTPDTYYGSSMGSLLRLFQVGSASSLPPIYHSMANTPSKQQRLQHQRHVDETTELISPGFPTVISPAHHRKFINLDFRMANKNDLSTGIQPFVFGQHTTQERQATATRAASYDLVFGAQGTPSLQDTERIISADATTLPRTFSQGRSMLTRTMVFTEVYFGQDHPLTTELMAFLRSYTQRETDLEEYRPRIGDRALLPAYLVRYVQLRYSAWVDAQWRTSANVEVPKFDHLFQQIDFGES